MILSEADQAKIDRYIKRFEHPEKQRDRVIQIIEMSSKGFSVHDIRKEVGQGYSFVSETRTCGRRWGLW
jgi:hypothetical protein